MQKADIDRRADVFSAGIVLWELFSGVRFWASVSDFEIMQALVLGRIALLPSEKSIPDSILAVCERATKADPKDRFQTAREMQEALDAAIQSEDLRISAKQISTFVSDLFKEEREQLKTSVETAMRSGVTVGASLTDLSVPLQGTGTGSKSNEMPVEATPKQPQSKMPMYLGGGVLALAGIVGLSVALSKGQPPATPIPSPGVSLVEAPTAQRSNSGANSGEDVALEVSASPLSAQMILDGRALGANPFRGRMPRDDKDHSLVISAKGYDSRTVSVRLDKDRSIELTLTPTALAAGGPNRWPPLKPSASTTGSVKPTETREPAKPGIQELGTPDSKRTQPTIDTDVFKK
jgi:eukaryotic-like serine/threonine-protein kinase